MGKDFFFSCDEGIGYELFGYKFILVSRHSTYLRRLSTSRGRRCRQRNLAGNVLYIVRAAHIGVGHGPMVAILKSNLIEKRREEYMRGESEKEEERRNVCVRVRERESACVCVRVSER